MHAHLVILFPEEEDVTSEYECDYLVKFKYGIDASDEESSERVEFIKIVNDYFDSVTPYRMVVMQHIEEIIKAEIGLILVRFPEFPVDFLYDAVCDHFWNVKLKLDVV